MLFDPSRADVRRFFCEAWRKQLAGEPLEPIEAIAVDWIVEHPEYHGDLASADDAVTRDYGIGDGRTNPFLHLAMHLAISEQLQIDQPPGIRGALERLARRLGSTHDAMHGAMECLGEMLWKAQRAGGPPDGAAYVDCVRRRAGA